MPVKINNPKIVCVDFNLNKFRFGVGIQVLINDPKNLEKIRLKEIEVLKNRLD